MVSSTQVLTAAAATLWGVGAVWAGVTGSQAQLSWSLAAAITAAAGTVLLSGAVRSLQGRLAELRRVCAATMLASSGSVLVFIVMDNSGVTDLTDAWLPLIAVHLFMLGLLVMYVARAASPRLLLAAGGALALILAALAAVVSPSAPPGPAHYLLGVLGWGLLLLGVRQGRTSPASRAAAGSRPPDLGSPAGPRSVVTTILLAAIVAAIILVALSPRGTVLSVVLVLISALAFAGHEIVRGIQQQHLVAQLAALAATDPLTGLGNRRALSAAMDEVYAQPLVAASVLTVDLDNFKLINTLLGHLAGDELLVAVADALAAECSTGFGEQGAAAFRLGGDEFAILVRAAPAAATALAHRLSDSVSSVAASMPGIARVDVSVSIGIAHRSPLGPGLSTDHGLNDLTRSGDAMRAAKAAGRAQVLTYGALMAKDQSRHDSMERRLRAAIGNGAVQLHYQPIISLPEMRMVGMESLARWHDEELGFVSPEEFIPIAEDCGLIVDLGLQLARRSMQMAIETGAHAAGLNAGVNVSPTQLRSPAFVRQMAELLSETGIDPQHFALEITESVRIEEDDPAVAAIWKLADLGIPIALDDFGTGYASLSLISSLPIKILKLDRSITQKLDDPRGLAIARCVSDMARALKIDVVAEGIETEAHLRAIRRLDVGFGQGWLFERAVTAERFTEFVRDPGLVLRHLPAELLTPATSR